ncbi:MAG: Hsp20/alpha crystallin family protein [Planctomycetaceae bacterium]
MPVFRWGQSWDPLRDLEREVDRLLQGMNLTLQGVRSVRRFPPVNLIEFPDRFLLTAEIPGMDVNDLEITAAGGLLTIKGVRRPPEEARDDSFRRQERFQGPWQRSIQLPDRVDEEGLKAEYTAGVLRILLPKAELAPSRSIPVVEGPG